MQCFETEVWQKLVFENVEEIFTGAGEVKERVGAYGMCQYPLVSYLFRRVLRIAQMVVQGRVTF